MLSYASYLLQADCPEQLIATDGQPVQVPINVSILSRDFDDLYPAMEIADEKLRVSIDGKEVTFFNATSEYLSLRPDRLLQLQGTHDGVAYRYTTRHIRHLRLEQVHVTANRHRVQVSADDAGQSETCDIPLRLCSALPVGF